jgi:hypothetical protein
VSWVRKRDYHILSSGMMTYTNDERFQVITLAFFGPPVDVDLFFYYSTSRYRNINLHEIKEA